MLLFLVRMKTKFLLLLLCSSLSAGLTPALGHTKPAASYDTAKVSDPAPLPWLRLQINIPARELRVIEHNRIVSTYPVAVGSRAHRSPVMSYPIKRIIWNPSWIPPKSPWAVGAKVDPPGPHNTLGPVKMKLARGIMIHGTNHPKSVGRAASHGCFRMRNEEAANLAWYLQERMSSQSDPSERARYAKHRRRSFYVPLDQEVPVDIIYAPVELQNGKLWLHQDIYSKVHNWGEQIRTVLSQHGYDASKLSDDSVQLLRKQLRAQKMVEIPITELLQNRVAQLQL